MRDDTQPAPNRFPSAANGQGFGPLAAEVHRLGLRFGVHIMRGIPRQAVGLCLPIAGSRWRCDEVANSTSTCAWNTDMCGVNSEHPDAFDWYWAWISQLSDWGVDFVKVDDIGIIGRPTEWQSESRGYRFTCSGSEGHWIAWLNTSDANWDAEIPAWIPGARRDCWLREDFPEPSRSVSVPTHGARLIRCA